VNNRLGVAILAASAGCAETQGPRLESATPAAAPTGAIVRLTGVRLCGESGDCATAGGEVQFGLEIPTLLAPILSYSDTSAEVEVPRLAPAGKTGIVVTVNESASNELDFEVLP